MPSIKIMNVTKKYGDLRAIDNLSLSINDGEYLCILGETGAGKTTLLRLIAGLIEPDEGEIFIDEVKMSRVAPEKRNAAYMFQQYALFPNMRVRENVSFGPKMKNWERERVNKITSEILEMVKLADRDDAYPNELSGGMQQRVALARGIASGAKILLLDEPLGALDARLRVNLRVQLKNLVKDQKLTAVHVTHDQSEALMTADRIVILRKGKIEQIGFPQDIYNKPKSIFVTSFVGGANFLEGTLIEKSDSHSNIEVHEGLHVSVYNRGLETGQKIVLGIRPENVVVGDLVLENWNNLSGVITSVVFVGSHVEYQIRLQNDTKISSKVLLSNSKKMFKKDEKVIVSFHPERCFLFRYPQRGLLEEIEAI